MRKVLVRERKALTRCVKLFETHQWPIELHQSGPDNFKVQYGKQIKDHLTYGQAATELGSCIMHFLACEGQLDNRRKGEK